MEEELEVQLKQLLAAQTGFWLSISKETETYSGRSKDLKTANNSNELGRSFQRTVLPLGYSDSIPVNSK